MKNPMQETRNFPWIKNSVEIRREVYDRSQIQSKLKDKFEELKCSSLGCSEYALAVKEGEKCDLRCKMHMPQTSIKDSFKKLTLVWYEFEEKLKSVEEDFIKVECLYNLISSPTVSNSIDEYAFKDLRENYNGMHDDLRRIVDKSISLGIHNKFEDFSELGEICNGIQKKVERVHQIIGTSLCYLLSSKMLNGILESSRKLEKENRSNVKDEDLEQEVPLSAYNRVFTFCSMFGELDENLDQFEIKQKDVLEGDSDIKTSNLEPIGGTTNQVESKGISMFSSKPDSVSSRFPARRDDPLRKNVTSSGLDFHHPSSTTFPTAGGLDAVNNKSGLGTDVSAGQTENKPFGLKSLTGKLVKLYKSIEKFGDFA